MDEMRKEKVMIKYCVNKWDKNKGLLEEAIKERTDMAHVDYVDLLKMVVRYILNDGKETYDSKWNPDAIHTIDDGDYQGTLLFLIPSTDYQPGASDYLMTCVYYGSCCGCDTLQAIQSYMPYTDESKVGEQQLKDFMTLCKDLVTSMIRPYKSWDAGDEYDEVVFEK